MSSLSSSNGGPQQRRSSTSSSSYGQSVCSMPTSVLMNGAASGHLNGITYPNGTDDQSSANEPVENGGVSTLMQMSPPATIANGAQLRIYQWKICVTAKAKNGSTLYGAGPQIPQINGKKILFGSPPKNINSAPVLVSPPQGQPIQILGHYPPVQQNYIQQPQFCAPTQPSTSNSIAINNFQVQSGVFNPYAMTQKPAYGEPTRRSVADTNRMLRQSSSRAASPCYSSSSSSYTTSPSKYTLHDMELGYKKAPVQSLPCEKLVIDGIKYLCTEQYYMYYKAHLFGDMNGALAIMSTTDPKLMKRIGGAVLNFDQDQWFSVSIQVMVIACQRKYEQNPDLRRQLFSTADTLLVEASPSDDRWGIGLPMDSMLVRDKRSWPGHNIMGRLLTMLRDRLLQRPEFAAERKELLQGCQFGEFRPPKQNI
uniref:NADAR domain-containing protein n=1 Tax=Ditylenchus dipsaci TaxID=166011 RepID=A0A915DNA6_9BILA